MKKIIRSAWEEDEHTQEIQSDTIYDEDHRESLIEDGEIDLWELAFMQGWDSAQ